MIASAPRNGVDRRPVGWFGHQSLRSAVETRRARSLATIGSGAVASATPEPSPVVRFVGPIEQPDVALGDVERLGEHRARSRRARASIPRLRSSPRRRPARS